MNVVVFASCGRIFAPEHHSLIGAMRVLETTPHFHLDFMDERLAIADLHFNLSCSAEQRAKFTRPPADKSGLVLSFKTVPSDTRAFQARHRACAISRSRFSQRLLIDQN